MRAYCSAIWRYRYFWLSLVKMDLRSRYRGSILGVGWSLMQPLAMTVIFTVIFCRIFHQDVLSYPAYVLTGLAVWGYFLASVLQGCQSFFQGEPYIRQHPAPLAIYPLRTTLSGAFHFLMALLLALLLTTINYHILGTSVPVKMGRLQVEVFSWLSLLPSLLLLLIMGWSLAILAGITNVYFRDTSHISQIAFQVLFYLTPVMYPQEILQGRSIDFLLDLNPFLPFLDLIRDPIVYRVTPSLLTFTKATALVTLITGSAIYALARLEKKLIFRL